MTHDEPPFEDGTNRFAGGVDAPGPGDDDDDDDEVPIGDPPDDDEGDDWDEDDEDDDEEPLQAGYCVAASDTGGVAAQ
jgi:hypothetical protein